MNLNLLPRIWPSHGAQVPSVPAFDFRRERPGSELHIRSDVCFLVLSGLDFASLTPCPDFALDPPDIVQAWRDNSKPELVRKPIAKTIWVVVIVELERR